MAWSEWKKFGTDLATLDYNPINGAISFPAVVGKTYMLIAVATMYNKTATASLEGATILKSEIATDNYGGTHGSCVLMICKATSDTITFTGSDRAPDGTGLIYAQLD